MTKRPSFRQADVTKALKPAIALGLEVSGYEITADGQIIVHTSSANEDTDDKVLLNWAKKNAKG